MLEFLPMRYPKERIAMLFRYGYLFNGERVCPDIAVDNFDNHLKVYEFAKQFCVNKRVLDIGCGTGYGSAKLAEAAAEVVGIDISRMALRFARKRYRDSGALFIHMNAERLQFPDHSFDFIVSTENFEHLRNQPESAREMRRVLKADGLCLLATPNPEAFQNCPPNPHHTHEYTFTELVSLLSPLFADVLIFENQLSSRKDRGVIGKDTAHVFGRTISTQHLSNTHSFFCFLARPR